MDVPSRLTHIAAGLLRCGLHPEDWGGRTTRATENLIREHNKKLTAAANELVAIKRYLSSGDK